MRFRFWGVRGSIPTPGPRTVKYGGNTTCIEVESSSGDLLILDAGTGIHALAQSLPRKHPVTAHVLLTHTHWDHIQGLPFFLPIFRAGNRIHIYGADDAPTGLGIERAMSVQLQHCYFPINEAQLKAEVSHHPLQAGERFRIGSARILPVALNHPVVNFGYRIDDDDGSSLFFTGDYEPEFCRLPPDDPGYRAEKAVIDERKRGILAALSEVDALIVDASYTQQEYAGKIDWGHGTYEGGIRLAHEVGARQLFFTHHEPTRSDDELEAVYQAIVASNQVDFTLHLAREGEMHVLPLR